MPERLDISIYKRGLAASRERARQMIKGGYIYLNGKQVLKASYNVNENDKINIIGETLKFVSRGGIKLEYAVKAFGLYFDGLTAIDMGASTGGFSDCMLQGGAKKIYAVDVGSGQLHEKIKNNPNVINMEQVNIRDMIFDDIGEKVDFISIDTSFISLKLILPKAFMFIKENGNIVALIKPQFEAGRENIGKGGIVKDKKIHEKVIKEIYDFVIQSGFVPVNITPSPITGGDGNKEYLMHIKKQGEQFDFKKASLL